MFCRLRKGKYICAAGNLRLTGVRVLELFHRVNTTGPNKGKLQDSTQVTPFSSMPGAIAGVTLSWRMVKKGVEGFGKIPALVYTEANINKLGRLNDTKTRQQFYLSFAKQYNRVHSN